MAHTRTYRHMRINDRVNRLQVSVQSSINAIDLAAQQQIWLARSQERAMTARSRYVPVQVYRDDSFKEETINDSFKKEETITL